MNGNVVNAERNNDVEKMKNVVNAVNVDADLNPIHRHLDSEAPGLEVSEAPVLAVVLEASEAVDLVVAEPVAAGKHKKGNHAY